MDFKLKGNGSFFGETKTLVNCQKKGGISFSLVVNLRGPYYSYSVKNSEVRHQFLCYSLKPGDKMS